MAQLTRTEQVPKEVVYAYRCDRCGKESKEGPPLYRGGIDVPDGWQHFRSSHNDWGNDSIETGKEHDACSWECYVEIVRGVFEDYGEPPTRGGAPRVPRKISPTLQVDGHDWFFLRDMLAHQPESAAT